MTMDIISGMTITASVFMLATALVALLATRVRGEASAGSGFLDTQGIAARVLAGIAIVFFVTAADLLLIAQQVSLALGTFVVGLVVIVLLYLEPSVRGGRATKGDKGDWRH